MGSKEAIIGGVLGLAAVGTAGYFIYKAITTKAPNTVLSTRVLLGYENDVPQLGIVETTNCGYGGRTEVWSWLSSSDGTPLPGFDVVLVDADTGEEAWSGKTNADGKVIAIVWVPEENMPDSKATVRLKTIFKGLGVFDPCESNEVTINFVRPCK